MTKMRRLALKKRLRGTGIEVMAGEEGLLAAAAMTEADTVVTAVMGMRGAAVPHWRPSERASASRWPIRKRWCAPVSW